MVFGKGSINNQMTIKKKKKKVKAEARDCISTNYHAWVHHPWDYRRINSDCSSKRESWTLHSLQVSM